MGSSFGTIKNAVDQMRKEGIKAGILRLRTYRPFPSEYVRQMLQDAKIVMVMDKTSPAGGESAPLSMEVKSAMYDGENKPTIVPFVYGLGSKDFNPNHAKEMLDLAKKVDAGEEEIFSEESVWVNLRVSASY